MSAGSAIHIENLSKVYKVYDKPLDMVLELITGRRRHRDFWALKDISFNVQRGEVVGVIGRNGAGKSTLLKILAGTLDKTEGEVQVDGKISAILELGTGFHPEYSGRENIYMGGLCLGMSRDEIDSKVEDIIEFSELREFIDQPFKTYSSGMQARLTFSVAISVEPDILIVDEALAAGDALFSEKCNRRIRNIVSQGATVFFCTHSMSTIVELCDTAILLSRGELLLKDTPREVSYAYDELLANDRRRQLKNSVAQPVVDSRAVAGASNAVEGKNTVTESSSAEDGDKLKRSPQKGVANTRDMKAEIVEFNILNAKGVPVEMLETGCDYTIRAEVKCYQKIDDLSVGFRIETPNGIPVYGLQTTLLDKHISCEAEQRIELDFSFPCRLQNGTYVLGGGLAEMHAESNFSIIHVLRGACVFNVSGKTRFSGLADLNGSLLDVRVES